MIFMIEILLLYSLGVMYGKPNNKMRFKWMPKVFWLVILIAIFVDPLFASTFSISIMPQSLEASILINGYVGICFYVGYFVPKILNKLRRMKSKRVCSRLSPNRNEYNGQ